MLLHCLINNINKFVSTVFLNVQLTFINLFNFNINKKNPNCFFSHAKVY